ncbi:MAG: transpeptidase family protein [Microscillaceae bacterium]|nr:transpeptidase family protein [Microscillaceae bacterium]MDW8460235.1 penicillin-binding protein [Cytophagales bacterium]
MNSVKQEILVRVQIVFLLIMAFSVAIVARILYIQLIDGEKWYNLAKEFGLQYRIKKATRGNIYAADGTLLATSIPLYKLSFDPTIAEDSVFNAGIKPLAQKLAQKFPDKTAEYFEKRITDARKAGKRYITLTNKLITYRDKKEISQFPIFKEGQLKGGVMFEKVEERTYPFKELAARTIGYINENDQGTVGIELSYNKDLAGVNGEALYQKITGGDWKPITNTSQIKPEEGFDVYTTLDINIQEIAHNALKKGLLANEADYGCAIVLEVETGYVRAMANLGRLKDGNYSEIYNYAIGDQGSTDPGSTFKLPSMVALFEDSTRLKLTDSIETGGGSYRYYDRTLNDPVAGGFGKITIQKAFEVSSSIGISKLITAHFGKKPQKFIDYLDKFGFTKPIGFQIQGEAVPYIKKPTDPTWSGITLPWTSIGYESRVTPLQIAMFYNGIANNGKMMQPLIVTSVRKADQILQQYSPMARVEKLCSDSTLHKVKQMLIGVVERGTARSIRTDKYKIAGKTGTSQKIRNGKYIKSYRTSFVGFFPADRPKYTCIVVIDNPKNFNQSGGDVSAPVFREIADALFTMDIDIRELTPNAQKLAQFQANMPADEVGHIDDLKQIALSLGIPNYAESGLEWASPYSQQYMVKWQKKEFKPNLVPSVKGMSLRDAIYLLENKGFKVSFKGRGKVKAQSIMPGTTMPPRGTTIILYLSDRATKKPNQKLALPKDTILKVPEKNVELEEEEQNETNLPTADTISNPERKEEKKVEPRKTENKPNRTAIIR